MITYPSLKKGSTIGVTAPSSGVPGELHELLKLACRRMEERGYQTVCKDTAWTQQKPSLRRQKSVRPSLTHCSATTALI